MNPEIVLAQVVNWLILASVIAASVYFVGQDTRRRALSWPETLAWVVVSIITFPIGFGLYYLLRWIRPKNQGVGDAR